MLKDDPTQERAPTREARGGDAGRRAARVLTRALIGLAAIGIVVLAVGFVEFAGEVSDARNSTLPAKAEGIVVFTGGQDRVAVAIGLLDDGFAKRLLISGVHPETTKSALSALSGGRNDLFGCCIDLDRNARDTIGNAEQTAVWARKQGYSSLIIVTSSYHMPRSLAELGRALPDVRLIGHAVSTSSVDLEHWWQNPRAASLLVVEYVKFLAARARLDLVQEQPVSQHAGSL
ncbi:MAG: YdcF family protein [Rhizobiales bacterium]|nr:YdcF family protein [Hyphomicrobiales bacterium]